MLPVNGKAHLQIIGPNLTDSSRGDFEVHAAGCRSTYSNTIELPAYAGWPLLASGLSEIAADAYADHCEENGFTFGTPEAAAWLDTHTSLFHLCPCAVKALKAAKADVHANPFRKV